MSKPQNDDFDARRVDVLADPDAAQARILPVLRRGGIALLPADTIYGLSCRWDSDKARERIQVMKGPGRLSLFVALVSGRDMAFEYAEPPTQAGMRILEEQWPGPITAVLRGRRDRVPEFCAGPEGTVAFRWPRSLFLQDLVSNLGVPLVSTSANLVGEPHAVTAEGAFRIFGPQVDLYADIGEHEGLPSTLLDLTGPQPRLLRLGAALPEGVHGECPDPEEPEEA